MQKIRSAFLMTSHDAFSLYTSIR